MQKLKDIKFFGNPIDIARNSSNWMFKSQEFYLSGKVLLEERNIGHRVLHQSVGTVISNENIQIIDRVGFSYPIVFCLSFSIELLVKAVLIKSNAEFWIPDNGKQSAFNHNVNDLIFQYIPIQFNDQEKQILQRIADYNVWGKYPERLEPNKAEDTVADLFTFHPYYLSNIDEFKRIIDSIRDKLMQYYFDIQNA